MVNRFSMRRYSFSSIVLSLLLLLLMPTSCKQKKAVVNQQTNSQNATQKVESAPVLPEDDTEGSTGTSATKTTINATKVEDDGGVSDTISNKSYPTKFEVAPNHGSPDERAIDSIKNSYPPKPR